MLVLFIPEKTEAGCVYSDDSKNHKRRNLHASKEQIFDSDAAKDDSRQ